MANATGSAVLDFGAGSNEASVAVTGQTGIQATSKASALSGPIAGTSAWRAGAWRVGAWRAGSWREQLVPVELPVPPFIIYAGKRETASARRSKRVRDCTR